MQFNDIKQALSALQEISYNLEQTYIENDGEVTEETESLETQKEALKELLSNEGIDTLGRWLKAKEDEQKTYKAERDAATARINACANTIEFIKGSIGILLQELGVEKVKGTFYSFAPSTSVTTKADATILKERYHQQALDAIHKAGIPECVGLTLSAAVSNIPEGEDMPDFFTTTTKPSCKFTKPRKAE